MLVGERERKIQADGFANALIVIAAMSEPGSPIGMLAREALAKYAVIPDLIAQEFTSQQAAAPIQCVDGAPCRRPDACQTACLWWDKPMLPTPALAHLELKNETVSARAYGRRTVTIGVDAAEAIVGEQERQS